MIGIENCFRGRRVEFNKRMAIIDSLKSTNAVRSYIWFPGLS
jgi:hypothetical protein